MKVSVVMPVYNELASIEEILKRVNALALDKEVIVVDDGSTDGTRERLTEISNRNGNINVLLTHDHNRGKGAALRTGFKHVTGDVVIVQDADLEYDPKDYAPILDLLRHGKTDVVYGSRFLNGGRANSAKRHYLGNKVITWFSNLFTNLKLTDVQTCYKAFRSTLLKDLSLKSNRFGFDPEFTAKVAKRRLRIVEVAISYQGRTYAEGKKITWRDGFKAIFAIMWFRVFN